jgi:hypothetical protein
MIIIKEKLHRNTEKRYLRNNQLIKKWEKKINKGILKNWERGEKYYTVSFGVQDDGFEDISDALVKLISESGYIARPFQKSTGDGCSNFYIKIALL